MKRILLALSVTILTTVAANAQTEKGTVLLAGNATYTNVEDESQF